MKKLSESLETLSARVKKLEDSATAAFEADRAKLEQRRREIDTALTADRDEFEMRRSVRPRTPVARGGTRRPTRSPGRSASCGARHEERQSEHELHRAMRIADAAEEDAAVAIEIATHWLNVAEYAVIDATLARMAADDLAMAADESPARTAGQSGGCVMIRNYLGSPRRLALRGVAAIVFGIATLVWPDVTLWALVVLWGAYALVDGTIALAGAISDKYLLHRGWVAVAGVSGIVAGVMTFVWPEHHRTRPALRDRSVGARQRLLADRDRDQRTQAAHR